MAKTADRNVPPVNGVFQPGKIPSLNCRVLDNGLQLLYLHTPVEGLVRIDLIVRAGSAFQPYPLVAQLSNLLLKEGCREVYDSKGRLLCKAMNTAEVADCFDSYGAYVYYSTMMEFVLVSLCTPTKYIRENLTMLYCLHTSPAYPEDELRLNLQMREQQWRIDSEKVNVMASMKMNEVLFGQDHPYGRMLCEEDFHRLSADWLHAFHDRFHTPSNTRVVVTGDVDEQILGFVEELFGTSTSGEKRDEPMLLIPPKPSSQKEWYISKEGASQAAVRLSLPTIGEKHPDFSDISVLNALLGGYFGSRLMMSLREKKGYTYGIYSTHTVYNDFSYIDIETQTAIANVKPLVNGVWEEMTRLSEELVGEEELGRLRNYLYGEYSRMVDGPFTLSDLYVSSLVSGRNMSDGFNRQLEAVRLITPERLRQLAARYLHPENFYKVCVGAALE